MQERKNDVFPKCISTQMNPFILRFSAFFNEESTENRLKVCKTFDDLLRSFILKKNGKSKNERIHLH